MKTWVGMYESIDILCTGRDGVSLMMIPWHGDEDEDGGRQQTHLLFVLFACNVVREENFFLPRCFVVLFLYVTVLFLAPFGTGKITSKFPNSFIYPSLSLFLYLSLYPSRFFLRSRRNRVNLLSYESKPTDKREKYDRKDEKKIGRVLDPLFNVD